MPGWGPGPDLPEGAFVVDPVFGRVVVVGDWAMRKIAADHGAYYPPRRTEILEAIANADGDAPDPIINRHRYWRDRVGGSRWLFVVVEYPPGGIGVVLTAFPRRRLPGQS